MDVRDVTNITGISKLVNYDGDKDLDALERDILGDIGDTNDVDDVAEYKQQLEELGTALGVSMGGGVSDSGSDRSESDLEDEDDAHPYQQSDTVDRYNSRDVDDMFEQTTQQPQHRPNSYMDRVTEEQKKQRILKHVLHGVEDQKFSVEKEKEEDDKAILLEQIDMLITNLKDEGIDVSRVPVVGSNSSIEDIENVHKILRLKNDRNRYCSFAEECILAGSHTLEWLFDGKKTYMGRRPDLRGWSATVNIKLRRMRYDTSTFVSEVMQDYNLGHGTRILFELLPSLFLYSKMKKSQYSDNLITSDEMNSAIDRIRDIEEDTSKDRD
jgi:hypothetical protein